MRTKNARAIKPDRSAEFASHATPTAASLWRQDGKARATVAIPKDAPIDHEGYRRLVAALPCIRCGMPNRSQCAHGPTLGKSIKCDCRLTFPLCADRPGDQGCHTQFDQYRHFTRSQRRAVAVVWAKQTREQIKAAGQWPANLPTWSDEPA